VRARRWLGLLLLTLACRPRPDQVSARVNGQVITNEQVRLEQLFEGDYGRPAPDTLESLIDQVLILQEGARLGVRLAPGALDAAEDAARAGTPWPELEASLQEQGLTLSLWRARLAQSALADEVVRAAVRSKVDIGPQEIQDYFWEHLPAFRKGKRWRVRQIYTKDRANARAAVQELELGEKFEAVAGRRGEGPEAARGGDLGELKPSALPKPLIKALEKLKPGHYSEPVRSPWGWHVLYLEEVLREQGDNMEQATPKAHHLLLKEKEAQLFQLWLGRLREKAVIERLAYAKAPQLKRE
jgi:peptidyl-prolyl cis-trans isomerase SurA